MVRFKSGTGLGALPPVLEVQVLQLSTFEYKLARERQSCQGNSISQCVAAPMTYEQPQNIRVFVSSTFVDLFGEREYLVKRVFPEIRHICRERGLIFTEVDLRWGLTYEDSSFGRVISTCLQEIDRCRPFFIGILGDRYGWIPEFQDIHKNAFLMEEHRWLEEAVLEGSSLVEMEFNYAVLNSNEPMPGASFYVLERTESDVGSSRVDLQACKLEYSIVSPK